MKQSIPPIKNMLPEYNKNISPPQDAKKAIATNLVEIFNFIGDGASASDKYKSNKGINRILVIRANSSCSVQSKKQCTNKTNT
ncbi:MAG: hypothetical protein Q8J87_06005, partial [Sediminibacterium sp.]|jgi:hypothetical protein|nr:hypothetical protein [Sediminibacterium sp.]